MVHQDRVLDKKYRLGRVLREGEHALILEGTHIELREKVAIKILQREQTDPRFAARLRREARQAGLIRSDHVVRYHDIGHLADGRPYLVMERLVGESLTERIARSPLSPSDAVDVLLETLEALAAAHVRNIVHRDLRTSNVFVTERADRSMMVKVLNFGTARAQDGRGGQEDEGLTVAALVLNAPEYKAPEQIAGSRDLDARCDLWSAGIIFYESMTGTHPFEAATLQDTIQRILVADVKPHPAIPEGLWQIVVRALRARREQRFATAAEFALALQPFASPLTSTYPVRISRILETPVEKEAEEGTGDVDEAPTAVREVLAMVDRGNNGSNTGHGTSPRAPSVTPAHGSPGMSIPGPSRLPRLGSLTPPPKLSVSASAVPIAKGPPTGVSSVSKAGIPRLGSRTNAKSWPWLKLQEMTSSFRVQRGRGGGDDASWGSLVLIVGGLAIVLFTALVLVRGVVVDVHVEARDPSAAATTVAPAPPPPPAPVETRIIESAPQAPAAAADSQGAPLPDSSLAARPHPRPPQAPAASARPPKPPSTEGDPWGWER